MPQTRRFHRLTRRLAELEHLLPATKPAGDYTSLEQDNIRAFRLLTHAECEHYFEESVAHVATRALTKYRVSSKPTKVLRSLAHAFCRERLPSIGHNIYDDAVR